MHSILVITKETSLTLLRSKIFYPALAFYFFLIIIANIISSWGIIEFYKLLFDLGLFFFHFVGVSIAILWGSDIIHQAQKEGYIELQLSSPIKRYQWVIGKYAGLLICLSLLSLSILLLWQLFMLINNFGWLGHNVIPFISQIFLIFIAASMTVFFASFCRYTITIFLSYIFWFIGLCNPILFSSIPENIHWHYKIIIQSLNTIWNLQIFNLNYSDFNNSPPSFYNIAWLSVYSLSLIFLFLSFAAIIFEKKDI